MENPRTLPAVGLSEAMQMPSMRTAVPAPPTAVVPPTVAEAELVERARTDPEAFGRLYEIHYDRILNYIYRRTLNVALAEELTSNTFFKALRHLPRYRRRTAFQAWLYRIAGNEIKMHWRGEQRRRRRETQCEHADLDQVCSISSETDNPQQTEQLALVNKALSKLPHRYQTVLALRYFEGLKNDEIAQVLGKKIGTVKSLISRGLVRLRKSIDAANATFTPRRHSQDEAGGERP